MPARSQKQFHFQKVGSQKIERKLEEKAYPICRIIQDPIKWKKDVKDAASYYLCHRALFYSQKITWDEALKKDLIRDGEKDLTDEAKKLRKARLDMGKKHKPAAEEKEMDLWAKGEVERDESDVTYWDPELQLLENDKQARSRALLMEDIMASIDRTWAAAIAYKEHKHDIRRVFYLICKQMLSSTQINLGRKCLDLFSMRWKPGTDLSYHLGTFHKMLDEIEKEDERLKFPDIFLKIFLLPQIYADEEFRQQVMEVKDEDTLADVEERFCSYQAKQLSYQEEAKKLAARDSSIRAYPAVVQAQHDKFDHRREEQNDDNGCYAWERSGKCRFGDKCRFEHNIRKKGQKPPPPDGSKCGKCAGNHLTKDCRVPADKAKKRKQQAQTKQAKTAKVARAAALAALDDSPQAKRRKIRANVARARFNPVDLASCHVAPVSTDDAEDVYVTTIGDSGANRHIGPARMPLYSQVKRSNTKIDGIGRESISAEFEGCLPLEAPNGNSMPHMETLATNESSCHVTSVSVLDDQGITSIFHRGEWILVTSASLDWSADVIARTQKDPTDGLYKMRWKVANNNKLPEYQLTSKSKAKTASWTLPPPVHPHKGAQESSNKSKSGTNKRKEKQQKKELNPQNSTTKQTKHQFCTAKPSTTPPAAPGEVLSTYNIPKDLLNTPVDVVEVSNKDQQSARVWVEEHLENSDDWKVSNSKLKRSAARVNLSQVYTGGLSDYEIAHASLMHFGPTLVGRAKPDTKSPPGFSCDGCIQGKMHTFQQKGQTDTTEYLPGERYDSDHKPMAVKSWGGALHRYIVAERVTGYLFIILTATKASREFYQGFLDVQAKSQSMTGRQIRVLYHDGGGAYMSDLMTDHLRESKIGRRVEAPHDPASLGFAENNNKIVDEHSSAAMVHAGNAPSYLWGEANNACAFVYNKANFKLDANGKPTSRWALMHNSSKSFDQSFFKPFLCLMYVYVCKSVRKGWKCYVTAFTGYSETIRGYRGMILKSRQIIEASERFCIHNVSKFPFRMSLPRTLHEQRLPPSYLLPPTEDVLPNADPEVDGDNLVVYQDEAQVLLEEVEDQWLGAGQDPETGPYRKLTTENNFVGQRKNPQRSGTLSERALENLQTQLNRQEFGAVQPEEISEQSEVSAALANNSRFRSRPETNSMMLGNVQGAITRVR